MTAQPATGVARSVNDVLSEEVRALLARRRMPARELAPVLGKSQQAVSDRLRGYRSWSIEDLAALASYFGVDANALLPGLGKQGAEVVTQRQMLPHLDSNQEPAGSAFSQVRRPFLSIVRGSGGREPVTVRQASLPNHEGPALSGAAS